MADETLLTFTADIVAAHVSHNSVSAEQLPVLIEAVYTSLADLGQEPTPVEEKREPAVSIRSSVKPDAIACLECGVKLKMLKRHLATDHHLSPADYKTRWGLASDYPLVAPDYAARRKALAVQIGLGRKPGQTVKKGEAKAKPATRKKLGVAFGSVDEPAIA